MTGPQSRAPVAAVVVAAGKGARSGQALPKQFATWRGKPVLRHSVETLAAHGIAPIIVAIPEGMEDIAGRVLEGVAGVRMVTGGATRQQSVARSLEALAADDPALVLVHDAARPDIPAAVIARLLAALERHMAAIPVLPVVDSLAQEADGMMAGAAERDRLRRVQTPQAFRYDVLLGAHRAWPGEADAGDDSQVVRAAGHEVALVEGDEALRKLTFAADFAEGVAPVRVGTGFDVHRLEAGEELWLCGVRIEHDKGLAGHSDADVAIHALVDALLGAIGAGDIGDHFPPSDPRWRSASSDRFLDHAARLVAEAGYRIGNADLTIVCEAPKIGPHRDAMRGRLSEILGVDIGALSVKATTTEKLGFTGRGEGIAATAVVSLVRI